MKLEMCAQRSSRFVLLFPIDFQFVNVSISNVFINTVILRSGRKVAKSIQLFSSYEIGQHKNNLYLPKKILRLKRNTGTKRSIFSTALLRMSVTPICTSIYEGKSKIICTLCFSYFIHKSMG